MAKSGMVETTTNTTDSPQGVIPPAIEPLDLAQVLLRYTRHPWRFNCATDVRLLIDGDALSEMIRAIDSARHTIDLETFILNADHTGWRFYEFLKRAVQRNVRVRLLYDFVGSRAITPEYVQALTDAGVEVSIFHPLILSRPGWAINRRDHRKIMIIDNKISFTGGINIADEYASPQDHGLGWRDTHVRIEGSEIARHFSSLFDYAWKRGTPYSQSLKRTSRIRAGLRHLARPFVFRRFSRSGHFISCPIDGAAVKVLSNREFRFRKIIHRAYMHAVENARHYILIENAYFIPDLDFRQALTRAAQRGVNVCVVLARDSDTRIISWASRHLYRNLLESGVRIFEYPKRMMHAKTAVIDDAWSIVGSYNFDHRSLFHNLEVVAVIADRKFAVKLRDQSLVDINTCTEITLAAHNSRPRYYRMLESAAYYWRSWL